MNCKLTFRVMLACDGSGFCPERRIGLASSGTDAIAHARGARGVQQIGVVCEDWGAVLAD